MHSLHLGDNPIDNVPAEIINQWDCLSGVRDYFKALNKGAVPNNEVKLLVLGNGRVGKTSLIRAMLDKVFDENVKSTDKIMLRTWKITDFNSDLLNGNPLKVNIWDFGGQEIYYTTHRLFIRTKALFLLVWDKTTEEDTTHEDGFGHTFENFKLPHWIDYIRTASKSPVIVVQNKVDKRSERNTGQEERLRSLYDKIHDFQHVSAKTDHQTGLPGLQSSIRKTYNEMPEVGQLIGKQWMAVKERLRSLRTKRSISYDEYLTICEQEGLEGTEHDTLIKFLHDTGFLYYLKDIKNPKIILDQQWAIDAVYAVLTRSNDCYRTLCRLNKSGFNLNDLDRLVWHNDYSPDEQNELLNFMVNAEVCFEYSKGDYIAPQLLPTDRPSRVNQRNEWKEPQGPAVKFHYEFLHNAIIERFIVRAGHMVKADDPDIWRNGIAIYDGTCSTDALVEAFPQEKDIRVLTHGGRPLILIKKIMEELSSLHEDYHPDVLFSVDGGSHFVKREEIEKSIRIEAKKVLDEKENSLDLAPFRQFLQMDKIKDPMDEKEEKGLTKTKLKSKPMEPEKPEINCFISYAHAYEEYFEAFRQDFEAMTANLPYAQLEIWTDKEIPLGADWHNEIQQKVTSCDLAILLISDKFMNSQYIKQEEVDRLFKLKETRNILVAPVYFYPCRFYDWPELQANQLFKPKGVEYGLGDRDKKNRFCYSDLIDFEDLKGGVKMAKNDPRRNEYMLDFVAKLEKQLKEMAKRKGYGDK